MKFRAITTEILRYHVLGRPLLVGTTSVELSDRLSARLRAEPLRRLAQVMLLRRTWMTKNNREEDGRQIPELQFLNSILDLLISPTCARWRASWRFPSTPKSQPTSSGCSPS